MFRGQIPDGVDPRTLMQVEPLRPEYQDHDARVAVTERQGLGAVFLFPTLGCGVEEALKHDVPATMASLTAFNRWLEEDWGFVVRTSPHRGTDAVARRSRTRRSRNSTVSSSGERASCTSAPRRSPASTARRARSATARTTRYGRVSREASIPVAFHLGDSGYNAFTVMWGGSANFEGFGNTSILSRILVSDRAIHDTIAALVVDGVFFRHPTLRVASIENGSDWLALLVKRLKKQANQTPWVFKEDPLEAIRRNVWVTPYCEEDLPALAELIGVERILFGSDWPHGEGLAEPVDFAKELDGFDESEVRKIMRDNALELLGRETI